MDALVIDWGGVLCVAEETECIFRWAEKIVLNTESRDVGESAEVEGSSPQDERELAASIWLHSLHGARHAASATYRPHGKLPRRLRRTLPTTHQPGQSLVAQCRQYKLIS